MRTAPLGWTALLFLVSPSFGQDGLPRPKPGNRADASRLLGFGVPFARYPLYTLLERPPIHKTLGITNEQLDQIRSVDAQLDRRQHEFEQERADARRQLVQEGATEEQLSRFDSEVVKLWVAKKDEMKIRSLNPTQRDRLKQIQVQLEGPMAFTRPEVQRRLNLREVDLEAIEQVITEGREQIERAAALPEDDIRRERAVRSSANREALDADRDHSRAIEASRSRALASKKTTLDRVLRLLTKRQRETYQKMAGEPFDMSVLGRKPSTESPPGQTGASRK